MQRATDTVAPNGPFAAPPRRLWTQRTPLATAAVFVFLPVLLLLGATALFAAVTEAHIPFFVRDAKAVYGIPFHAGAVSSIGILLWCTAAASCFLTAAVLKTMPAVRDREQFLLAAGLLTSILMLDDLFLLHEVFAPQYLGIHSNVVFGTYALLTVSLLVYFRRVLYRSAYALLLLSLAFLAGSIAVDVVHDAGLFGRLGIDSRGVLLLLEDGAKLLGIAGWLSYFGWTSFASLTQSRALTNASPTDLGAHEREARNTSSVPPPTRRKRSRPEAVSRP